MWAEGWSFIDALYMVLMTLTTVGFEEVRPLDTSGEVISISVMVLGVTNLFITVSLVAAAIAEGGLGERGRQRRMQRQIDQMKDHYIVCGYGRVGQAVAYQLVEERAPFCVVDRGEHDEEDFRLDGLPFEIGDATQESVLRAAGIERARGIICALPDDPDNVFIALAARSITPEITIVSRLADPTAADRLLQAGVDHIISPYEASGRQMALAALARS
jgi:voltage-gated potassium channel